MWSFAFRSLRTRPARTALGLFGLSISVVGVLGLCCLSGGLRTLVADALGQIQGVMVVRENVPTPVFSDRPADLAERLRSVPGVRAVALELGFVVFPGARRRPLRRSPAARLLRTASAQGRAAGSEWGGCVMRAGLSPLAIRVTDVG